MSEKNNQSSNTVVPNDGSYLGAKKGKALKDKKVKADFEQAWESQKGLLKSNSIKLYKDKTAIGVQWQSYIDWDDSRLITPRRIKRTLNALGKGKFPHTANAVNNAVAIAKELDLKIQANSFSWLDYPQWIPKKLRPKDEIKPEDKTIAQWIEEYEAHYWLSRNKKRYQDAENWDNGYLRYLKKIPDWSRLPSKEIFDDACRSYPKSSKRNECCTRIKYFAHFCGLTKYDPKEFRITKKQITVKAKPKRELTDAEVEAWYKKFPFMTNNNGKPSEWELWRWMYGMQATYGFRNHETLNIFNLDEEYRGEDGKLYAAFTDKEHNPRGIVYTEGKGVKRAAFLPHPMRWLDEFSLRDIPKGYYSFKKKIASFSEFDKAKAKAMKLHSYGNFLREHEFTFTAYNLRHHYNVKSHHAGLPASIIAKNLGHTLAQNTSVYLSSEGLKSCLETIKLWEQTQQENNNNERTTEQQIEELKRENEQLKALIQQLLENLKTQN